LETSEILKRVRKIEIKTRGLSNQLFSGHYHSVFKGRGMAFTEVREYQYGDDIRSIDWNVTARLNHPYIKVFEEERELTVVLVVDVSGSNEFGTQKQFKAETIAEIAAVLAFSAIQNNDKVGVIFFSDRIEKFIPPKKGTSHILRIIRELIDFRPQSRKTSIAEALRYLTNAIKKRSIVFLLTDFMDQHYEDALKIAGKKHDMVCIRICDPRESELPNIGMVRVRDAETGRTGWMDSGSPVIRSQYMSWYREKEQMLNGFFQRNGIDHVVIRTGEDYVKPLINLFKQREARH